MERTDRAGEGRPAGAGAGDGVGAARVGVGVCFFLTGAVFATWAARVPSIAHDLGLDEGDLAIAFMALNAGAMVGLQLGGTMVPRTGSRPALRAALPGFAASLVLVALAPDLLLLCAALLAAAASNSVVDVAMNAHGVTVERRYGRPVLSGLHAMHPLGGIAGAAAGALAARLSTDVVVHFTAVAIVAAAGAVAATRLLLPAAADARPPRHAPRLTLKGWLRGWSGRAAALGALAFCVTLAEGSILDWGAVYLTSVIGAGAGTGAAGVAVFLTGMTLGRLAGDPLTRRFGPVALFRAGSLLAGAGFCTALLVNTTPAGIVGLGLLGAGTSYLLPLALSAAGNLPHDEPAASVARVSTLAYLGSFVGPGLIGAVAAPLGLAVALALPAALVAGASLGARLLASPAESDPS